MGVLSGRDLFNPKYITAIITDAASQVHFVPIKYTMGDYFLTEINGAQYVFKIIGSRVKVWSKTLTKTIRILQYDITHYRPISSDVEQLKLLIGINNLPKISRRMADILKLFAHTEKLKGQFEPHTIDTLMAQISQHQDRFPEEADNFRTFLENLKIQQIVTPVKGVSEFLDEDLKASDPRFFATIVSHFQRADLEHKKITNTPIGAKGGWIKILAIVMMIGLIGAVLYIANDSGAFESITGMIPSFEGIPAAVPAGGGLSSQYTPEQLKIKVESGEIKRSQLSSQELQIIDSIELPTVTIP